MPSAMKASSAPSALLRFDDGATQFRQRIVVSVLSHRPVLIRNIRADSLESPGLTDYEASFLRLIDALTNGTRIDINATGTQVKFRPGLLMNGDDVEHACPDSRGVGWFLEGILPLAPFGRDPLSVTFTGLTDGCCELDPSCDYWKATALGWMTKFGVGSGSHDDDDGASPSIRILRRAAAPESQGKGRVHFFCPVAHKELSPIDETETGKIKRVRGTVVSCKVVSSSLAARVAYAAKGVCHRLLPDVWIHTDVHTPQRHRCGPSPGLSALLTAESTTGVVLAAEACWKAGSGRAGNGALHATATGAKAELPEDLGQRVACQLLNEVKRGGCADTSCQSLLLLWMCLTPEDVSRIRLGTLSQYTIETLRLIKRAFDVEFKVTPDLETKTVLLSCLGVGYKNMARAST